MTLIDKTVRYMFLILIKPVFKLGYLSTKVVKKKSENFLHNIHPGPFYPYVFLYLFFDIKEEDAYFKVKSLVIAKHYIIGLKLKLFHTYINYLNLYGTFNMNGSLVSLPHKI